MSHVTHMSHGAHLGHGAKGITTCVVMHELLLVSVVHIALFRAAVCLQGVAVCCSVLQCVAVCCSVLQRVAVCCSVLQCVAVCCSV